MEFNLESKRIGLINCSLRLLSIILRGDNVLSQELKVIVPKGWSEFEKEFFKYALYKLKEDKTHFGWLTYLPICKKTFTVLGSCGFKGAPNSAGVVEVGFEVAEQYRNFGFATEMVELLKKMTFSNEKVRTIIAHTLAIENPSVHVLKKTGFVFVKEIFDKEDGTIWRWEFNKNNI